MAERKGSESDEIENTPVPKETSDHEYDNTDEQEPQTKKVRQPRK